VELLKESEWINDGSSEEFCNTCGSYRINGHEEYCTLAAFLTAQASQGEPHDR
jgi:hypothetical protein